MRGETRRCVRTPRQLIVCDAYHRVLHHDPITGRGGPAGTSHRGWRGLANVRGALARPDFYPVRPDRVDVRETHISWVFLTGDRAYKLKKPLVLPFLGYSTSERRRLMCPEEMRLNRRLALRGVSRRARGRGG